VSILLLMNTLNFLDRGLLSANAPLLKSEFHLSNAQYGEMLSAFSLVYALMAPFAGALLDRIGLLRTVAGAVIVWSMASAWTGISRSFGGLLLARCFLGLGEAAALPCSGKGTALYLPSSEWGFSNSVGSIAVTLGIMTAPLLAGFMAPQYGWRSPFLLSGVLGIIWVALWWRTSTAIGPDKQMDAAPKMLIARQLRDGRLWLAGGAYALVMVPYMFWLNWTTIYLVQDRQVSMSVANRYFVWIPPLLAVFGGFLGGALAYKWIRQGTQPLCARLRVCWICAPATLATAVVPWVPSTALAILCIGITLFFCMAVITSLNVVPVDLFGTANAGFTTAVLACSYALLQTFVSPAVGGLLDRTSFGAVCPLLAAFPLLGVILLRPLAKTGPDIAGETVMAAHG
jgi:MFS family permease